MMALDQTIALHKLMLTGHKRTAKEIQEDLWQLYGMHPEIATIKNNLQALEQFYNVKKELSNDNQVYYWIPKRKRENKCLTLPF
jgi:hypothetical protein